MCIRTHVHVCVCVCVLQASLCNLSIAQVSDFREIFRQIDLDNNGSIDEQELKQLLTSIHSDDQLCSEDFVRDLMARVKNVQKEVDANDESLEFTVSICIHVYPVCMCVFIYVSLMDYFTL